MPPSDPITTTVRVILGLVATYAAFGVVFAVLFQLRGIRVVDPGTQGAGPGFLLMITPGIIALWPILVALWLRARSRTIGTGDDVPGNGPRRLRSAHGLAWGILGLLVPVCVGIALAWRPTVPSAPLAHAIPVPEATRPVQPARP